MEKNKLLTEKERTEFGKEYSKAFAEVIVETLAEHGYFSEMGKRIHGNFKIKLKLQKEEKKIQKQKEFLKNMLGTKKPKVLFKM